MISSPLMDSMRSALLRDQRGFRSIWSFEPWAWASYFFFAAARPPLRPAALCCAVVPPCLALPPEPDFLPPFLEASGELAIFAARRLDIPLSLRASYCFSFLTLARVPGMGHFPFNLQGVRSCLGVPAWPERRL